MTTPEFLPYPYPSLVGKEQTVPVGEYQLLLGNDESVNFDPAMFEQYSEDDYKLFAGIHFRGVYTLDNGTTRTVMSFLYHKRTPDGELETTERAIITAGVGYGEHPGHPGQPPTWYEVGAQMGTINPETGGLVSVEAAGILAVKHFSIACITGGPFGEPILANPPQN